MPAYRAWRGLKENRLSLWPAFPAGPIQQRVKVKRNPGSSLQHQESFPFLPGNPHVHRINPARYPSFQWPLSPNAASRSALPGRAPHFAQGGIYLGNAQ